MMTTLDIEAKEARLLELAREKFGVRAKTLSRAMKKIGRRVPARLHKQAAVLVEARRLGGHPKLMMRVDGVAVSKAFDEIVAHLETIDVADRRKGAALNMAAALVFNLLVVIVLVVLVLRWQGLV
ncbi:MAG: hypothetical protein GY767_03735 [Shimia sp.]|nr:hypothetical protein [Shimia sp.]MCP4824767.1 hypothetical protein [Shimia sp.]